MRRDPSRAARGRDASTPWGRCKYTYHITGGAGGTPRRRRATRSRRRRRRRRRSRRGPRRRRATRRRAGRRPGRRACVVPRQQQACARCEVARVQEPLRARRVVGAQPLHKPARRRGRARAARVRGLVFGVVSRRCATRAASDASTRATRGARREPGHEAPADVALLVLDEDVAPRVERAPGPGALRLEGRVRRLRRAP